MNEHEARIWNAAIDKAVSEYKNGIGAIMALRLRYSVTVDHIGRSTKQEVKEVE